MGAAAERVLARAVAVAPSARQTDARELLRELEEAAKAGSAHEPVVAPKPVPEPRPVRRDGRADVVTANGDLDSVSVVLTQADGAHIKFGAPTTIRLPGEAHGVAVADLDDDGCPDLAIPDAHDRTYQVHVYAGDCRGGFVRAKSFKVAGDAYGVTASDLNGDGQPDLVVTTPVGLTVLVNTSQPRGSR